MWPIVVLTYLALCSLLLAVGLTSPPGELILRETVVSLILLGLAPLLYRKIMSIRPVTTSAYKTVPALLLLAFGARALFIWLIGFPAEKTPLLYLVVTTVVMIHGSDLSFYGFRRENLFKMAGLGAVLGMAFYYSSQAVGIAIYYAQTGTLIPFILRLEELPLALSFGMVLSALTEEAFFRGYLQTTLAKTIGHDNALIASASLFGAWHFLWLIPLVQFTPISYSLGYGGLYAASTALSGILYAQLYRHSFTIIPSAVAHGFWNLLLTVNPPLYAGAGSVPLSFQALNPVAYGAVVLAFYFIVPRALRIFGIQLQQRG